jgi:hypothetical protein
MVGSAALSLGGKSVHTLFTSEEDPMPRLTGQRLPKYGKHKASGQAVVKLDAFSPNAEGRKFTRRPMDSPSR